MNICGHIIITNEIIGIGPLMCEKSQDQLIRDQVNRRLLWFMIHLRYHSIKIESGWLDLGFGDSPDSLETIARNQYTGFQHDYEAVKEDVLKLIGESAKAPVRTIGKKQRIKTAATG